MRSRSFFAACVCLVVAASASAADDPRTILGSWRGTSLCVNLQAAPACRDEEVLYKFRETTPPAAGKLTLQADKIVDGKVVPMGVLDLVWDSKASAWTSEISTPRVHALWSYALPKGDELAGTLVSLPDRALLRKVAVRRSPRP